MGVTGIEWTDVTDNIITVKGGGWWCRKVSPACANCYAERINQTPFFKGNGLAYTGEAPEMILREDIIDGWVRQRTPKRHFIESMSDVFGEWVPQWMIHRFLDGMLAAHRQTFQMLTKRVDVMAREVNNWLRLRGLDRAPNHMWFGATAEDQPRADERVSELLKIPGITFLSCEPLLGAIEFNRFHQYCPDHDWGGGFCVSPCPGRRFVNWIIAGGETGPQARPSHPAWFQSLRDQSKVAGVPFFFKQKGDWDWIDQPWVQNSPQELADNERWMNLAGGHGFHGEEVWRMRKVGKKAAGRLLDGVEWSQFPEVK